MRLTWKSHLPAGMLLLVASADGSLVAVNDTTSPLRNCTPGAGDCTLYDCAACCTVTMAGLGPATCSMCWVENCPTAPLITTPAPTNATTAPSALARSAAASAFVTPTCPDPDVIAYVEKLLAGFTCEGHVGMGLLLWAAMSIGQLPNIPEPAMGKPLGVLMWAASVACMGASCCAC